MKYIILMILLASCQKHMVKPMKGGVALEELLWDNHNSDNNEVRFVVSVSKGELYTPSEISDQLLTPILGKALVRWEVPKGDKFITQYISKYNLDRKFYVFNMVKGSVDIEALLKKNTNRIIKNKSFSNVTIYVREGNSCTLLFPSLREIGGEKF